MLSIKKSMFSLMLGATLAFGGIATASVAVNEPAIVYAVSEDQAMCNLQNYVYSNVANTEYELANGGSVKGADLFEGSASDGWDLNESKFTELSNDAKTRLVSDVAKYSKNAVEDEDGAKGVDDSTVTNWWKQLQTKEGVGSRFMMSILENTKPDFATANEIYQPFSPIINTVTAVIAVVLMALLGLSIVIDVAYMALPPFQGIVRGGNTSGNNNFDRSFLVSNPAKRAVEEEENNGINPFTFYLKKSILRLIVLGICLLYLVQGQIYTLVGYVLDLVSGFLGF